MTHPVFSVLAEIEWDFDGDSDVNRRFLVEHSAFTHKEACEFIVHVGAADDPQGHWVSVEQSMRDFGCHEAFIRAYSAAKDAGATRVLFWS